MNILVVNDDGVKAQGIFELVQALSKRADVYVCAPDSQQSAKSQSLTLRDSVYVREISFPGAKKAFQTTGTPADCTKIGIQFLREEGIETDMVYSGINLGSNLGTDTLYSGTIGAAQEAALHGINAVAVSVDSHEATYFDAACDLAVKTIDLVYKKVSPKTVISINTPDLPKHEIKGIKCVRLGGKYYEDSFRPVDGGGYVLTGEPGDFCGQTDEEDVVVLGQGYATITPLQFDYTDYESMDKVKQWDLHI